MKHWANSKISDLCTLHYGKSPKEIEVEKGIFPIYGTGGVVGATNECLYANPSIILGRKGSIGNVHYVDMPFWTIDTTFYVEPKNCDVKWLYYIFCNLNLEKLNEATGVPSLSRNNIYSQRLLIPEDKYEQQKIAEVLSTVDHKIDLIDQKIAETQKLKTGLMQKLFSEGVGVQDENGDWQPHTEFDSNRIPLSWKKGEVLDFLQLQRGHDLPVKQRVGGDVPIIGSNGVAGYHSEAISESCGVITGRSGTLGKLYFSEGSYWPLNTSLYIKDFKGNSEKYCFYFLQQFKLERFGTGTGVPTLNRNIVHKQPVAFPPLSEQVQVTAILDTVGDQLTLLEKQKSETQQLKKGLMQKLLTGEWRVPLDNQ